MLLDVLGKSVVADDVCKPQIKNYLEAKKAQSRLEIQKHLLPFPQKGMNRSWRRLGNLHVIKKDRMVKGEIAVMK